MTKEWEDAVLRGDIDTVRYLLEGGAEIDSLDKHGQSGLMVASMRGHTEVARLLIERGAELNRTAKFRLSALMLAAINNHAEIAKLLADAGADQSLQGSGAPGFHGKTALDLAEKAGHREIAEILKRGT